MPSANLVVIGAGELGCRIAQLWRQQQVVEEVDPDVVGGGEAGQGTAEVGDVLGGRRDHVGGRQHGRARLGKRGALCKQGTHISA